MSDGQVNQVLDQMERALVVEDPAFVKRVNAMRRSESRTFVAVFVLLSLSAVLMTIGLATAALIPFSAGALALAGAVVTDYHHEHHLRRE